jgi:hypothetical protein
VVAVHKDPLTVARVLVDGYRLGGIEVRHVALDARLVEEVAPVLSASAGGARPTR